MLDTLIYCPTIKERDELFALLKRNKIGWSSGSLDLESKDDFKVFPCYMIYSDMLMHATLEYCESESGKKFLGEGIDSRYHIPPDRYLISVDEYFAITEGISPDGFDFTNLESLL